MTTLRLILGDQLNPGHSWFTHVRPDVVYTLMEIRQETDYVLHHAQKILGIFAGMRHFAQRLRDAGHLIRYFAIDAPDNTHSITGNLDVLINALHITRFEYQAPDEYRLDQQLAHHANQLAIATEMHDSEHFYTTRHEAAALFKGRKQWLMEHFYRQMRTKHRVLLNTQGKPEGGQWNYDHDNRKPWHGDPREPEDIRVVRDHSALWQTIVEAGVKSFGNPQVHRYTWPLHREEALEQLDIFISHRLAHFGDFQDAMSQHAWRLFHALISFALNTKMLSPREVVQKTEAAYRAGEVPLTAAEGFIRQILGWREYVRGVYWANMPGYTAHNVFQHTRPLPAWFWTGETGMNCLSHAIGQSLEHAYAHHIQRLMVIGNFGLLAGLSPFALHEWYLGIYIDAFEWVEAPNTLGMSQFADGGLLATKPYVSSAAYIDRMGDYCKSCQYQRKERIGKQACPFNALYWDFFARHRDTLGKQPRLAITYRNLDRMDAKTLAQISAQAASHLANIESL